MPPMPGGHSKGPCKVGLIGSPDVFRLRKEPINSLSCVRTYVRAFQSYSLDRSIFFSNFPGLTLPYMGLLSDRQAWGGIMAPLFFSGTIYCMEFWCLYSCLYSGSLAAWLRALSHNRNVPGSNPLWDENLIARHA